MKKLISLFLAIIFLLISLASCSGKDPELVPIPKPSPSASSSSESSSETSESTETTANTSAETTDAIPEVTESSDTQLSAEESTEVMETEQTEQTVGTLGTVETEETEQTEQTEETEEILDGGKIRLSAAGKASYRVIRPKSGDITKNISMALVNSLNGVSDSISFELKADNYPLTQDKEILVGYTDRDETASVFSSLKVGGWTVREVGNKIVVYGTTSGALDSAAKYVSTHLDTDSNGNIILDIPEGGYTHIGNESFFGDSNPLSDYVIVAADGFAATANTLKSKIKSTYGIELEVKTSSAAAVENEIIIGNCSRGVEASILDASSKPTAGYAIKAIGSKLIFNSHMVSSLEFAVSDFIYECLNDEFSDEFQLLKDYYYASDICYNIERPIGSEVRIMSFNVLADAFSGMSYNGTPDLNDRYPHLTATILSVMPDVIGFQELDFFTKLSNTLSSKYAMINTAVSGGQCWNCIAYNKSTLTLVEKGTVKFSHTNQNVKHKNISWAVFELKSTGEKFVFVNAHWDVSGKTPDYRPEQATETAKKVNDLRSKYNNCPAFTTGDYNSNKSEVQVTTVKTNANLTDAIDTATTKVNHSLVTYHTVNSSPASGSGKIDYILHTSNATALLYFNLAKGPAVYASDHCPIFADFKLN